MRKCALLSFLLSFSFVMYSQSAALSVSLVSENSSSTVFSGNPSVITEYRGSAIDSLKKYSIIQLENSRIVSEKIFNPDGTEKSFTRRIYTSSGKVFQITGFDPQGLSKWSYSYNYNAAGNLIEETSFDSEHNVEWKAVYDFTDDGKMLLRKTLSKDNNVNLIEKFSYSASGKIDEYISMYGDGKILKRVKSFYDENDNLSKQSHYDAGGLYETVSYTYDDAAMVSEIKRFGANENLKNVEARVYRDGRLVYSVLKNPDDTICWERKRFYDWKGNFVCEQNETEIIFREYSYQEK